MLRVALSLTLLLGLVSACGREPAPASGTPVLDETAFIDATGGVTIDRDGIRIEIAGARYRLRPSSAVAGGSRARETIEGFPFGVRDGVFFVGNREYGPAPGGSIIRVTATRVTVDDEDRGPLPLPAEAPDEDGG